MRVHELVHERGRPRFNYWTGVETPRLGVEKHMAVEDQIDRDYCVFYYYYGVV